MIIGAYYIIGLVAICYLLLLYYMIRFVLRYQHEYESSRMITITVIACLSVVLIAAALLPVDIYLVSSIKDVNGTLKPWATNSTLTSMNTAMFASYYTMYGMTIVLIFIVLPFMHFYHEEQDATRTQGRAVTAIKYTLGFALIASLLMVAGCFLPLTAPTKGDTIWEKLHHLFTANKAQDAVNLLLSIITSLGMLNLTFYTGIGIVSWPIGLIRGTNSMAEHLEILNERQLSLRIRVNAWLEKSRITALTQRERNQLERAEDELRTMSQEEQIITDYSNSLSYRMRKIIRPSQIIFGVLLCLLTILIVVSLFISNVDKLLNGLGAKAGYILTKPNYINPLNVLLVEFQKLSVLAPFPILFILFFFILATISGMRNLGLWFLIFPLYKLKVRRTVPQGLLYFSISMMLTVLAYNVMIYFLVPQFVTYGDQNYIDAKTNTTQPCTMYGAGDQCYMTVSATLIVRFMSQVWIFGPIFYWLSWTFGVIAILSTVAHVLRARRPAVHGLIAQDEFEE